MTRSFLPVLALALVASTAKAQLLYHTGFETPNYVAGQTIDGIDGWASFISPLAPLVVANPAEAAHGRRALTCWGGDPNLETTQGLLDGAWAQTVLVDPSYAQTALVRVQCDVRLDGPDTGSGPANDLVSANLYARNGVGGSAFVFVSSTGDVYCFADSVGGSAGYQFATPITLGQYTRIAITLDYATHLAAFEVNGVVVGVLPFGGQATEFFRGATLEFAAYDDPLVVDPSLYTGYWDNLMILEVPSNQ
jgi:hypothetical protein